MTFRDKLIGRQTAKRAVFRWNDNVKATCREHANDLLFCKAVQGELWQHPQKSPTEVTLGITGSEVPITASQQPYWQRYLRVLHLDSEKGFSFHSDIKYREFRYLVTASDSRQ